MKVDPQITNYNTSRPQSDDLRMESSPRGRARLNARLLENIRIDNAEEISGGETSPVVESKSSNEAPLTFSEIVTKIAAPASQGLRSVATRDSGTASVAQTTELLPFTMTTISSTAPSTIFQTTNLEEKSAIHTPFGAYNSDSINKRVVFDVIGSSPMEVYFMTHQPGEWMRNPGFRDEFVKLYGTDALQTVDRHGTVPKNVEAVWVTKPTVDAATGRA